MIGWRGASRYYSYDYKDAFERCLEFKILKQVKYYYSYDTILIEHPKNVKKY